MGLCLLDQNCKTCIKCLMHDKLCDKRDPNSKVYILLTLHDFKH